MSESMRHLLDVLSILSPFFYAFSLMMIFGKPSEWPWADACEHKLAKTRNKALRIKTINTFRRLQWANEKIVGLMENPHLSKRELGLIAHMLSPEAQMRAATDKKTKQKDLLYLASNTTFPEVLEAIMVNSRVDPGTQVVAGLRQEDVTAKDSEVNYWSRAPKSLAA